MSTLLNGCNLIDSRNLSVNDQVWSSGAAAPQCQPDDFIMTEPAKWINHPDGMKTRLMDPDNEV